MSDSVLLLVVDRALDAQAVAARAQQVMSHWQGQDRPSIETVCVEDIVENPSALSSAGVAWLVLDNDRSPQTFELIGQVQDRRVPAVLSLPTGGFGATAYDDGVVSCPFDADELLTCSVLRSLWCQAPVFAELHREIKLLRAHEGGLCGQIAQLDEELRMAAKLQKEFMPTELPRVGGIHFDVLWRPAGYVSGDIYDVVRLDETHLGFFIADAVGHGVPAALMTVHIQRSMPTKITGDAYEGGYRLYTPGEAIGVLNQEMIKHQTGKVRFATACYGVIDLETRQLTVARAGHPYPLILRADGNTDTIEPDGALLGVFPDEQFEEATVTLEPGDRVLLYSDGFEVAFPTLEKSEENGSAGRQKIANNQYAHEFEDLRHGNAEVALDRLAQRLNMQSGSLNQRDDLTVICMTVGEAVAISETDSTSKAATAA